MGAGLNVNTIALWNGFIDFGQGKTGFCVNIDERITGSQSYPPYINLNPLTLALAPADSEARDCQAPGRDS